MANQSYEFLDKARTQRLYSKVLSKIRSAESRCLSATDGTVVKTVNGKIPSEKLPSYIDDILEFATIVNITAEQDAADADAKLPEAEQQGLVKPTISNLAPTNGATFDIVFDEDTDAFYARVITKSNNVVTAISYHSTWNTAGTNWQDQTATVNGQTVTYAPATAPTTGKLYFASETEKLYRWVPAASGTGGTMLDITSKTVYASGVDSDEVTTVALGNLPAGKTAEELKGMTISELLDNILFSDTQPKRTPAYDFTFSWVNAALWMDSNGLAWVGMPAPANGNNTVFNLSFTQRSSNYKNPNTGQYPKLTGAASSSGVTVKVPGGSYGSSFPENGKFGLVGVYYFKGSATYGNGDTLYTKRGALAATPNPITGSTATKELTVKVTFPMFTNGNRDTNYSATENKKYANLAKNYPSDLQTMKSVGMYDMVSESSIKKMIVDFAAEPVGLAYRQTFYYPNGMTFGLEFANPASGEWETPASADGYEIVENAMTKYLVEGSWVDTVPEGKTAQHTLYFNKWTTKGNDTKGQRIARFSIS